MIKKIRSQIEAFAHMESSGGIVLFFASLVAMYLANSPFAGSYQDWINTPITGSFGAHSIEKSLLLLVNDGLMAIFFFLVGLEIKREVLIGELSSPKKASFSIFAALGGMIVPAGLFLIAAAGSDYSHAWGIPMATDIAFALGVLSLFGNKVPAALKVFLLALAIVDDLGAISVIALFYTEQVQSQYLILAMMCFSLLFLLQKMGIRNVVWGITLGVVTWFCFLKSGVHATLAGVLLAMLAPKDSLDDLIHNLHPWTAFLIMPVFALFNAGVSFDPSSLTGILSHPLAMGIGLGLVLGKPIGVTSFAWFATRLNWAQKPDSISWAQVLSVGFISGIGFTMSLFIATLSFDQPEVSNVAKFSIVLSSLIAGVVGSLVLWSSSREE